MATNPNISSIQKQISSQGLTREQATAKYGLTDQDVNFMTGMGLRFSTTAAPAPSLMSAQGPVAAAPVPMATPRQAQGAGYTTSTATAAPKVTAPKASPAATAAAVRANAPATPLNAGTVNATRAGATDASVVNQAPASTYQAAQGAAATWTPGREATVAGQVADIVDSDSPLMEQAATRGLQQANRRGLMNSSMAAQATQAALYDAALPIAQQDAGTFARSGEFNAGNQQEMELSNVGARNQASRDNAAAQNDRGALNAQLGTQVNLANAGARTDVSKFNAAAATQVATDNVDRAMQAGIFNREQAAEISKFNADLLTRTNLANMASKNDLQQFLLNQQFQAGVINQQQFNEMSRFNATQQNDAGRFNATLSADISKFNASESNDLKALGMDSATRLKLGEIEANYKMLMQTSASGADLYKQMIGNIAQVLQNKDMDANAKSQAIGNLVGALNSSLGVIGDLANMNIPELDFSDVGGSDPNKPPEGGGGGGSGGGGGLPGGSSGQASNGYTFPNTVGGTAVNWNAPGFGGQTLRQQYERYASNAGASALSPEQWMRNQAPVA